MIPIDSTVLVSSVYVLAFSVIANGPVRYRTCFQPGRAKNGNTSKGGQLVSSALPGYLVFGVTSSWCHERGGIARHPAGRRSAWRSGDQQPGHRVNNNGTRRHNHSEHRVNNNHKINPVPSLRRRWLTNRNYSKLWYGQARVHGSGTRCSHDARFCGVQVLVLARVGSGASRGIPVAAGAAVGLVGPVAGVLRGPFEPEVER